MLGGLSYQEWRDNQEARGTLQASLTLLGRVLEVADALGIDVMNLSHDEYLTYRRNHMELWLPTPSIISLYSRAYKWAYIRELASVCCFADSLTECAH
jgi:hypothetical protein